MNRGFVDWLTQEIDSRGWSNAELARRAEIAPSGVSMVISGASHPGLDFCVGVARALNKPPEDVLRLAGLLPSLPPAVAEEREALTLLRGLPATARSVVMTMLRALGRTVGSAPPPALATDPGDVLNRELLSEFERVPDEWKQEVINQAAIGRELGCDWAAIGECTVFPRNNLTFRGHRDIL